MDLMGDRKRTVVRGMVVSVVSFIVTMLTFPAFEPDYGTGLDSSYVWGLNYLFSHDYDTLLQIVHVYGPLALLRLPLIEDGHFVVFLLFYSVLKMLFVAMGIMLALRRGRRGWLVAGLMVVPCLYANVDVLLVVDVGLMLFLYVERRREMCFLLASLLASVGLFIKLSIGVEALAEVFVAWVIAWFVRRDVRATVVEAVAVWVVLIVVAVVVHGVGGSLLRFVESVPHSLTAHSESMVLDTKYPVWVVALAMCGLLVYPLLSERGGSRWLWLIMLLPVLANYKYGSVRSDYWHYKQFVYFVSAFVVLLLLSQRRLSVASCCWAVLCFGLVASLLRYMPGYGGQTAVLARVDSGWRMTVGYNGLKRQMKQNIETTKAQRLLPEPTLQMIGDGSVECYPWEQVFVAANGLRWQPRPTFEEASSLSPWLQKLSAANYGADSTAVNFVIWHRTNFGNAHDMRAVDDSYLLSEEPWVVRCLLNNYHVLDTGWYGLLLKHNDECDTGRMQLMPVVEQREVAWGEWLDVPLHKAVQMEVDVSKTLYGNVRSLIYKTCVYYVDYMMSDGEVMSYRFLPSMSEGGLWVNPMLESYDDLARFYEWDGDGEFETERGRTVSRVRFRCSHPQMVKDLIVVKFMPVVFENK